MWWICVADISRALWVPCRRLLWQQVRRRLPLSGSGGWRIYVMNIQIGELLHTSCAGPHIVTWESLM